MSGSIHFIKFKKKYETLDISKILKFLEKSEPESLTIMNKDILEDKLKDGLKKLNSESLFCFGDDNFFEIFLLTLFLKDENKIEIKHKDLYKDMVIVNTDNLWKKKK